MLHAPCLDNKSTQKKPDQQWVLTGHYKEVLRRAFGVSKSFRMPSKGLDYIAADPVAHGREYATPAATASVEDVDAVIAAVPSATPMISPAIPTRWGVGRLVLRHQSLGEPTGGTVEIL